MSSTSFFATLGSLVNVVLHRVLTEIEDQVDISEEESIRLNKLCKILHGLEDLFIDESVNVRQLSLGIWTELTRLSAEQSSVGREVPIWFKFVFLSELLEASMVRLSPGTFSTKADDLAIRRTFSSSSTIPISSTSQRTRLRSSSVRSSRNRRYDKRISSILWLVIRTLRRLKEMERAGNERLHVCWNIGLVVMLLLVS